MTPVIALIFGMGLAASTATQLRLAGPFGPGEGMLIVWLLLLLFRQLLYQGVFSGSAWLSARVSKIWILILGSVAAGIIVAQSLGLSSDGGGVRDLAALFFVAALSVALSGVSSTRETWQRLVDAYLVIITICLAGLLAIALARVAVVVDPWFQAIRFRGWSENPNQMALMLAPLPFLILWAYQRTASKARKSWLAFSLAVSLIAGVLCLSEALYLAWGASLGLCSLLAGIAYVREPTFSPIVAIWKKITFPTILLAGVAALVIPLALRGAEIVAAIYEAGNQGETRLLIWGHGLEAAARSPIVGLGPGAFSGLSGPFQNYEAHNTFIDILTQAGVFGAAAYVLLLIVAGKRFLATRDLAFIGGFTALVGFSCFHYVLRHPTFWLTIILMLRLTSLGASKEERQTEQLA